jgi:hypothetical protein
MKMFETGNQAELDELVDEIAERFVSSISSGAGKVIDIHRILLAVSDVSEKPVRMGHKSECLILFQSLVTKYFEAEENGTTLVESAENDAFSSDVSTREISVDAQMVLSVLHDIYGGIEGRKLLCLGDPSTRDYTALLITKFLHGLAPASIPHRTVRQHHLFGKLQTVRFDYLHDVVRRLL